MSYVGCRLKGIENCGNTLYRYCQVLLVVNTCVPLKMQIEKKQYQLIAL